MTLYYGRGPRPSTPPLPAFQLDSAPQKIFALGRLDVGGKIIPLGTAFLLDKTNLVATAAHVVGRSDDGLVMVLNPTYSIHEYQTAERTSLKYFRVKIVAHNPIHDLAVLSVQTWKSSNWNLRVGSADSVTVGSDVVTFGYPHLNMGRSVLTRHQASVGAKVLLSSMGGSVKSLILNLLTRPGQSGSPVFRMASDEVVGVLTGAYRPSVNGSINVDGADLSALHQTTHVVSAEYLKGMY